MATITFTDNNNPNPGLEDVLDQNGNIITANATTFELRNNNGGATNNFIFRFTGAGFTFDGSMQPTGGAITGGAILDSTGGDVVATLAGISNVALNFFWSALQNNGTLNALEFLLGGDFITPETNNYIGSNGNDHLTTFGLVHGVTSQDIETLDGGAGNDLLTFRSGRPTLIGGTGNDVFQMDAVSFIGAASPLAIHGSAGTGAGGGGETDTIEVRTGAVSLVDTAVTNIDAIRFADPPSGPVDKFVTIKHTQVGSAIPGTLAITGSAGDTDNAIVIVRDGTLAANINLSGWQFTNFSRSNQTIQVALENFLIPDPILADQVIGSSRIDNIFTGRGNDTIRGGLGADQLHGGSDNDHFNYNAGEAAHNELVDGGSGTDIIRIFGNNNFSGVDILDVERFQFLSAATLTFDRFLSGEEFTFIGNAAANRLNVVIDRADDVALDRLTFVGWSANDSVTVNGSARSDEVTGTRVNDTINGNAGRDFLSGEVGNDRLNGGAGIDILSAGAGNDIVNGGTGMDTIEGKSGNDTVDGGSEADSIDGGLGNDGLRGGNGSDFIDGGAGNDTIRGDAGHDRLEGGAGNDLLNGGFGNDTLEGGPGSDGFLFNAPLSAAANVDDIVGFAANDTIRLENAVFRGLAAGTLKPGAFNTGTAATQADDRIIYNRANGDLLFDFNGSLAGGGVKFAHLTGAPVLGAGDILVI